MHYGRRRHIHVAGRGRGPKTNAEAGTIAAVMSVIAVVTMMPVMTMVPVPAANGEAEAIGPAHAGQ